MLSLRSRRTIVVLTTAAVLAATGGGVAHAAKVKPPKPFKTTRIVVGKSEGGIALGASKAATEKIFGASHCSSQPGFGTSCDVAGPNNSYSVYVALSDKTNKVDEIVFQSLTLARAAESMRTDKFIHIGSTLAQTKKAYKIRKSTGPGTGQFYVLKNGHLETQFVFNGKGKLYEIDLFSN